jgi:SAM-dependent methyltransferase
MTRESGAEILDQNGVPDALVERAYRDLARIHHWLGDTRFMVEAIRQDPLPVRRVLDVGCATGLVLEEVGRRLRIEVVGADLRPHPAIAAPIPIIQADALCDPLPPADVAFSMHLGHHLSERELAGVIRNVGRFCRRFILLDLVRHPLPLAMFRLFIAPLVCAIDAEDGQRSIRRSYTPTELRDITASALAGTPSVYGLSVAPFYVRQVMDISYANVHSYVPEGRRNAKLSDAEDHSLTVELARQELARQELASRQAARCASNVVGTCKWYLHCSESR